MHLPRQAIASRIPALHDHGGPRPLRLGLWPPPRPSDAIATSLRTKNTALGVIGIGPRCTYDLKAMLTFADVQCVAIADVQASRREAGKKLVDGHYGNSDCKLYRDFRELLDRKDIDAVLIATGDRWHAPASILAAKAGKDVYSEKPCGLTIADCQELADTMNREKRVFQAGTQRRSVPNFQKAVELAHSGKLGKLHTLHASVYMPVARQHDWLPGEPAPPATWSIGTCGSARRPGGRTTRSTSEGGWRGYWDFDSGARLLDWGAHTVDLCQWANKADDTMPIEYEPSRQEHRVPLRQRREAGARFPARRRSATRPTGSRGWAPARCGSSATRAGWKPATTARSWSSPSRSQNELPETVEARERARRLGPRPQLLRLHPLARADGRQSRRHAALAHRLPRRGPVLDSQAQAHVRSGEGGVHRRRRSQPAALPRPARVGGLRGEAKGRSPGRYCAPQAPTQSGNERGATELPVIP